MNRVLVTAGVALAMGAGVLAGNAAATGGSSNGGKEGQLAATPDVGVAVAPNARIAAFVDSGGAYFRSKGVADVTNPGTGVYCIDPERARFNVNETVPSVSVEWGRSIGDALLAQWYAAANNCPTGWLEVLTFSGEDGTYDFANTVAFTIVVP